MVSRVSCYILSFPFLPIIQGFITFIYIPIKTISLLTFCCHGYSLPKIVFWYIFFFGSFLSTQKIHLNSAFEVLHQVANIPNVISENHVSLYNVTYYTISSLCAYLLTQLKHSSQGMPFPNTLLPPLPFLVATTEIRSLPLWNPRHLASSSQHTRVCLTLWFFVFLFVGSSLLPPQHKTKVLSSLTHFHFLRLKKDISITYFLNLEGKWYEATFLKIADHQENF